MIVFYAAPKIESDQKIFLQTTCGSFLIRISISYNYNFMIYYEPSTSDAARYVGIEFQRTAELLDNLGGIEPFATERQDRVNGLPTYTAARTE